MDQACSKRNDDLKKLLKILNRQKKLKKTETLNTTDMVKSGTKLVTVVQNGKVENLCPTVVTKNDSDEMVVFALILVHYIFIEKRAKTYNK